MKVARRVCAAEAEVLAQNDAVSWVDAGSGERRVRLAGYGSLLSVASARRTCPQLRHHRLAWVQGYRRIFCLVSLTCVRRGPPYADWRTREVAACAAFPGDSEDRLAVALFDIPASELQAYLERESRYEFTVVNCLEADSSGIRKAIMCVAPFDRWAVACPIREQGPLHDAGCWHWYSGPLWRKDVLPSAPYLHLCLRAAAAFDVLDEFLDASYLADGCTTLRSYLRSLDQWGPAADPISLENTRKLQGSADGSFLIFAAGKWN